MHILVVWTPVIATCKPVLKISCETTQSRDRYTEQLVKRTTKIRLRTVEVWHKVPTEMIAGMATGFIWRLCVLHWVTPCRLVIVLPMTTTGRSLAVVMAMIAPGNPPLAIKFCLEIHKIVLSVSNLASSFLMGYGWRWYREATKVYHSNHTQILRNRTVCIFIFCSVVHPYSSGTGV